MKRPRKIQLPSTKAGPGGPGHQDSDEDGPWRLEDANHGRGYEGDTSSGSGRSLGERSHRPRAGRRSRAGDRGSRSPGGGSEVKGLALMSGFKRLPRQDVQMRPLKSVLVRRRESEGEPAVGVLMAVGLGVPLLCMVSKTTAPKTSPSWSQDLWTCQLMWSREWAGDEAEVPEVGMTLDSPGSPGSSQGPPKREAGG